LSASLPNLPASGSHQPLYNIGAVTRLTGIAMTTLRAWERRYNFPDASRSSGGQRLYSEADIIRLRWVQARVAEGMQPSQAVLLLNHLESAGQPTSERMERETPEQAEMVAHLVDLLSHGDLEHADQVLTGGLASSSSDSMILNVVRPVLTKIGELWETGRLDIAAEHLATHYLRQKLLLWMASSPPPLRRSPVVLACAPQEWHDGSLLILGALLRHRRIPVVYLGQALPMPDLASYIRTNQPALVVLVAMTELSVKDLLDLPIWLPEILDAEPGKWKPVIGFGGQVFITQPEWQTRISGVYLGDTFEDCLDSIERILG
jgi:MerR family transcriptional regulator, light-induced transcriptional regulator